MTENARLSMWGVGPRIFSVALLYAAAALAASFQWPDVFRIRLVPYAALASLGVVFLLVGAPMLIVAGRSLKTGYDHDRLVISGLASIVRHPIYSAWIVFLLPGLSLLSRSWPVLLTPLVAYGMFKLLIHREDEYLERRFGAAYVAYRAHVRELLPVPKSRRQVGKAMQA